MLTNLNAFRISIAQCLTKKMETLNFIVNCEKKMIPAFQKPKCESSNPNWS